MISARRRRWIRIGGQVLAACLLGGAGLYLIYGEDKGTGIFAVLIAAILCRLLVIDLDERLS